tara:strand:+ start:332 stop:1735 length:1404 start_codon:yes stop_codon:yes gene_type:complete
MAIPFLNHLDLRSTSQLKNAILDRTTEGSASNVRGKIIYDTGTDTIKYYSHPDGGSGSWVSLTGDTNTFRTIKVDTTNNGTANETIGATEELKLIGGTNITLAESGGTVTINAGAATTVGKTNATQRSGSIELIAGSNVTITEDGTTGHYTFASTDTNTNQLTEWTLTDDDDDNTTIAHGDHVKFVMATGALSTNTTGSGTDSDPYLVTLTSPDTQYTHPTHPGDDINVDSGALTGAVVVSDIDINVTTDTLGHVTDANGSVSTRTLTLANLGYTGATDANNYSFNKTDLKSVAATLDSTDTLYIGDADDDTTVVIRGTLQVDGTTTTVNSETLTVDDNKIVLNDNVTGTPTEDAGIIIERGNQTNVELRWNEGHDDWEFTAYNHAGTPALTTYKIPTTYKTTVGGATSSAVTHNLGSRDVIVQLYDSSSYETVHADVVRTNTNTVTLTFAEAPATGDVTVLISKVG